MSPSSAARTWPTEAPGRDRGARASALVLVMIIMSVLSVVAASLLLSTTARYHTAYQSASWQEAVVGAEAGVDLAMSELRKRVVQGPNAAFLTPASTPAPGPWTTTAPNGVTTFANYGHAFPGGTPPFPPFTLGSHGGEGNTALQTRVFVDVPGSGLAPTYSSLNFAVPPPDASSSFISQSDNSKLRDADGVDRSRWWYRVRALGVAGLAGPPQANLQKLDNRLRRFSFFTDWRTGQSVSTPQTARLVEAIVRPQTNFRNALMADKQIDLGNKDVLVDSYDSSKGLYDPQTNHGQMGNLATNGTLINANLATVNGNAMTNSGSVTGAGNVTGQQSATFYQELTPLTTAMLDNSWGSVPDLGTITTDAACEASTDPLSPTTVRLDGINLSSGNHALNINPPANALTTVTTGTGKNAVTTTTAAPSYIKIYVQGDISINQDSFVELGSNVNAIIYFTGNVSLQNGGIYNDTFLARNLVLNGIQPPANADGTFPSRTISIATSQDFEGIIYAPNHDLTLALTAAQAANSGDGDDKPKKPKKGAPAPSQQDDHARGYNGIYGGFVARTITVQSATHLHYDETLRQIGPVNHYDIVNWFEDNLSRDALGGTELFWWPTAGH